MPMGTLVQFMLPRWVVKPIAMFAGLLAWRFNHKQRLRLEQNFRHIMGASTPDDAIRASCRRTFQNLVMNYLDLLRGPVLRHRLPGLCEFDPALLDSVMSQGRGLMLITGHIGNWDLAGAFLAALGYPISAVVEPIPRGWSKTFNRYRSVTSLQTIPIPDRRAIARALLNKRLLALVSDRDLTGHGLPLPAFDATRSYPKGPAAYALRFGTPVVMGYLLFQDKPGRPPYYAHVEPPLQFESSGDTKADVERLTAVLAECLNRVIARHPEQWFVFNAGWQ